jgi:hypothetical protein
VICHHDGCPTARDHDDHGRLMTVQHGYLTQPVLHAPAHHLLNREIAGENPTHLTGWTRQQKQDAANNVDAELARITTLRDHLLRLRKRLVDD